MNTPQFYAAATFDHCDWHFDEGDPVDPTHPMVELRPDLFTDQPPKPARRRPTTTKE